MTQPKACAGCPQSEAMSITRATESDTLRGSTGCIPFIHKRPDAWTNARDAVRHFFARLLWGLPGVVCPLELELGTMKGRMI